MTKKRFNFTVKSLSNLPVSDAKGSTRTYYYDTQVRGFGIYVTEKGVKTFFVYKKVEGRPVRIVLGRTDEITLEKARAKAQDVHSQIAEGINPQEKKRAIRQEITLGELWEIYLERHAKLHRSSWRYSELPGDKFKAAIQGCKRYRLRWHIPWDVPVHGIFGSSEALE